VVLVDAGPLIAMIDQDDRDHERCVTALRSLTGPILTTWPAFTEAMYLLGRRTGWVGQQSLWTLVARGDLLLADLTERVRDRAAQLMEKYQDVPMDLADATLVALAEARRLSRIVTLDRDFEVYRLHGRKAFKLLP
jgi:predicted nucleic acid-binding protein